MVVNTAYCSLEVDNEFAAGLEVSGLTSLPLAVICFVLAGLFFVAFCGVFLSEYWLRRKEKPLSFVGWSGTRSLTPSTRLSQWDYDVVIQNNSEELNVGVQKVELRIERGSRSMTLLPVKMFHPILRPLQATTLKLHFESRGGLEKQHEDVDWEYAKLFVTDTKGNICGPLDLEEFPTNV